jgi:hypothetical protein
MELRADKGAYKKRFGLRGKSDYRTFQVPLYLSGYGVNQDLKKDVPRFSSPKENRFGSNR